MFYVCHIMREVKLIEKKNISFTKLFRLNS